MASRANIYFRAEPVNLDKPRRPVSARERQYKMAARTRTWCAADDRAESSEGAPTGTGQAFWKFMRLVGVSP